MEKYIIIFSFSEYGMHGESYSLEEALSEHPQIKKYLKSVKALELTPNTFIIESNDNVEDIYGQLSAFIDRHEAVFIFKAVFTDWTGYGNIKLINKISKKLDLDISKFK